MGKATPSTSDSETTNEPAIRAAGVQNEAPQAAERRQAGATNDWCSAGLSVLDAETCYLLPSEPTTELLIYLHGVVPPIAQSPQAAIVQRIVVRAARRAAVAVLMPRGIQGIGPAGRQDWWSWPTHESIYRKHAAELIERLHRSRLALEGAAGRPFQRMYLAGSSAGAYFVALLVARGALPADGYGAMSGGSGFPSLAKGPMVSRPFYIGYGTADSVRDGAEALARSLRLRQWPVKVAPHPFTHGAREVYLDEAIAFWRAGAYAAERAENSPHPIK